MRRVTVYANHIEVRYLLHETWNYDIKLAEVNSYLEVCYYSSVLKNDFKRVYLLVGRELYLYIDEGFCGNYDQMLQALKENWGVPQRDGVLKLTFKEQLLARWKRCIELKDISDDELQ